MKEQPMMGFTFQEIPLEEAKNAVIAGDGNYADIKAHLLAKLPTLEEKAFAFGLPGGREVSEDQRRGICQALMQTFKRAEIPWRITYSGTRKVFICMPTAVKLKGERKPYVGTYRKVTLENHAQIIKLAKQGKNYKEIAGLLNLGEGNVERIIKEAKRNPETPLGTGIEMQKIIGVAAMAYNVESNILTDRAITSHRHVRKAIQAIAVRDYSIPKVIVGKAFGVSKDAINFNLQTADKVQTEIAKIKKALGRE